MHSSACCGGCIKEPHFCETDRQALLPLPDPLKLSPEPFPSTGVHKAAPVWLWPRYWPEVYNNCVSPMAQVRGCSSSSQRSSSPQRFLPTEAWHPKAAQTWRLGFWYCKAPRSLLSCRCSPVSPALRWGPPETLCSWFLSGRARRYLPHSAAPAHAVCRAHLSALPDKFSPAVD